MSAETPASQSSLSADERAKIDAVLFANLANMDEEASRLVAEYTAAVMEEGRDFAERKRPWMLKRLAYLAGQGPDPGPLPEKAS